MEPHRKIITTLIACVVFLGITAGYKINQIIKSNNVPKRVVPALHDDIPVPDSTFLQEHTVDAPMPIASPKLPSIPGVTARAYLVGNIETGKVYISRNRQVIMPVASMSKLVTAFAATDMLPASSTIEIIPQALLAPPDKSNLTAGERFTLHDILYPLLLDSSNVAAEAISSSTGNRDSFLLLMRSYAWEVGMPHSYFADPSGVSPQNAASAQDIFGLAKYLFNYRPDILALTRSGTTTVATTTDHGSHEFVSTHPFNGNPRFIGGKTGRTLEAGETMMTILDIDDQPIAIIILGARYGSRESDTRILLQKFWRWLTKSLANMLQ